MKFRKVLSHTVIGLVIGLAVVGRAEALAWKGFSELCFEGEWKGGSVKDGELTVTIKNAQIQVRCYNTQAGESCQAGEGNAGDIIVKVPATADPSKEQGVISANGCIPLDRWDHHFNADHQHICLPSNNVNKVEVENSAHITRIDTEWVLTKTDGKVQRRGYQTCFWDGVFHQDTCEPQHGTTFTCPIDEEFRK